MWFYTETNQIKGKKTAVHHCDLKGKNLYLQISQNEEIRVAIHKFSRNGIDTKYKNETKLMLLLLVMGGVRVK